MLFIPGAFNFLFQPLGLAVERAHGVRGGRNPVHQAFPFRWRVFKRAYDKGNRDSFPSQLPLAAAIWLGVLLAADAGKFFLKFLDLAIVPRHLADLIDSYLRARGKNIVSDVLFVEDHNLFDGTRAGFKVRSYGFDFANHDGTT